LIGGSGAHGHAYRRSSAGAAFCDPLQEHGYIFSVSFSENLSLLIIDKT